MSEHEVMHHIHCRKGDVGRYVLLPGDPGRCALIAEHFDDADFIAQNREYVTYTGTLLGEKVSVTSTGIGCPSTAIAVEELVAIGVDTLIRVGTSGGIQPGMRTGDLTILSAAIRDEGTSSQYMPLAYPAVADVDVVVALREAARRRGARYHVGVGQSKDSFYGEVEPQRMPLADELKQRWHAWVAGGALCSEMEASTLFVVSKVLNVRAGGIMLIGGLTVDWWALDRLSEQEREAVLADLRDRESGRGPELLNELIATAVEGLRVLITEDRKQAGG
jgi:uridine phosphorylase